MVRLQPLFNMSPIELAVVTIPDLFAVKSIFLDLVSYYVLNNSAGISWWTLPKIKTH